MTRLLLFKASCENSSILFEALAANGQIDDAYG